MYKFNNGFIDGCFDLFHYGHMNGIFQSKQNCKTLYLATHSNSEILKAKNRQPMFDFEHRLLLLQNCKFVDIVSTIETPYNTNIEIINNMNCDIFFHAEDGIDQFPLLDIKNANMLFVYDRTHGVSTTNIIARVHDRAKKEVDLSEYLTKLYTNMKSICQTDILINSNIILLKCDWDLFNKLHIKLIKKIIKKYGSDYKIIVDLTNDCDFFNKYELRVLLYGIVGIYDVIIDNTNILTNCNKLVLINTNLLKHESCIVDHSFRNDLIEIAEYKKKLINEFTQNKS